MVTKRGKVTLSDNITFYYIVRKNVAGAYLLDNRNKIVYAGNNEQNARDEYSKIIANKQKNETYTLFVQINNQRYLQIIQEQ